MRLPVAVHPSVLLSLLFTFAMILPQARAAEIAQIDSTSDTVILNADETELKTIDVGTRLIVTLADGRQCTLSANSKTATTVVAANKSCDLREIKKGDKAEKLAGFASETSRDIGEAAPKTVRFALGAGINMASTLNFEQASFTPVTGSSAQTGFVNYRVERPVYIQAEIIYSGPNQWGVEGGLEIYSRRKLSSEDLGMGSSVTSSNTTGNPTLGISLFYVNGLYRFENFYLPFGVNISAVNFTNAPQELRDAGGTLGLQFGVGMLFNEHLAGEALLKEIGVSAPMTSTDLGTFELGKGFMTGLEFGVKYIF